MGARRNADADAVGLEFLRAREARHRQLGLGQRQRREIRIVAHVGDDTGHHRGLPRLVFPDRGVLGQHMRHLVAQHRGQFRGVAGKRDQAARHIELAGRQRERVHRAGIEDGHAIGLIGAIGRRDQPVDGLADQGGSASDRHRRRHRRRGCAHARARSRVSAPRCDWASVLPRVGVAVSNLAPILPQAASIRAAHSSAGAARRRQPVFLSRRVARCVKSATGITIRSESPSDYAPIPLFAHDPYRKPVPSFRITHYFPPSTSICPTRSNSIRGPPRDQT